MDKLASTIRALAGNKYSDYIFLALLTALGLLVHGYHPGLEDDAVYMPAIKYHLDSGLYPHDSMFFMEQMKFTLYPKLMAVLIHLSHLPISLFFFVLHLISVFLVLLGCLKLSRKFFCEATAQWASVSLIATLLSLPVTGTALLLVDQYLHPRSFAIAFILFGLTDSLDRRFARGLIWIAAAAVISPLMAIPGALFAFVLAVGQPEKSDVCAQSSALSAIVAISQTESSIWDLATRSYFHISLWEWYELFGVVAPLMILFALGRIRIADTLPAFPLLNMRLSIFGLVFTFASFLLCTPHLERFLAIQPMRCFHLVYLVMLMALGGLIGSKILKDKPFRWLIFLIPFCITMFSAQRYQFASSNHIELPGMQPRNQWVQAFHWVRDNTPKDAFFALDPYLMQRKGVDFHGFRALAERSMLCDLVKDPAVVSVMFTAGKMTSDNFVRISDISQQWYEQVSATRNWKEFNREDFLALKERFGVGWVLMEKPGVSGLTCVYENDAVRVCRID